MLKKFFGKYNEKRLEKTVDNTEGAACLEVAKFYKIGEPTEEDCACCEAKFPASLKFDMESVLFNSAEPTHAHILVASGRHDWLHDVSDEKEEFGRICKALQQQLDELEIVVGGHVRINACDLEFDNCAPGKVALIVLPHFLRIDTTAATALEDMKYVLGIPSPAKSKSELGAAVPVPEIGFLLLCSHKSRDKRCGITAPIMRKEFEKVLRNLDLFADADDDSPGKVRVVYTNHVGGHKLAANVLSYKNNGQAIMMARCRPQHAKFIVEQTLLHDTVYPKLVRSCTKLDSYQW